MDIKFLVQLGYSTSVESNAIISASLLKDCYSRRIAMYVPENIPDNYVPVGSVEWCRDFAKVQGKVLYEPSDYPEHFKPLLKRNIRMGLVEELKPGVWTKPTHTKLFPAQIVNDHSPVMYDTGEPVESNVSCWISDIVRFGPEFRCYVLNKQIMGISQYDAGDDYFLSDNHLAQLTDLVESWDSPTTTYALDVGILEDSNELALVELNAAWATGYYPSGTLSAVGYADWLSAGWLELDNIESIE